MVLTSDVAKHRSPSGPGAPSRWIDRVLASVVDVVLVVCPVVALTSALAERFNFEPRPGARPRFTIADQARINEIDEGFSRAITVGDTLYTMSGQAILIVFLTLALATVLVYFAVPAMAKGRSPGQLLLGVSIEPDPSESPAEPGAAGVATVEHITPVEINSAQINAVEINTGTDPTIDTLDMAVPATRMLPALVATQDPIDLDVPAETEPSIEPLIELRDGAAIESPSVDVSANADPVDAGDEPVETTSTPTGDREPDTDESPLDITDRRPAPIVSLGADDEYRAFDEAMASVEEPAGADHAERRAGYDGLALPESSLSESPLTTTVATRQRSETSTTSDGITIEAETATDATTPAAGTDPVWSATWQAWLYWDEGRDRWFRHDTDADRWVVVDA